jgi:hypothetical protein
MHSHFFLIPLVALVACGGIAQGVSDGGGDDGGSNSGSTSGGSSGGTIPVNHRPNDLPCIAAPPASNCMSSGNPADMCSSDAQCTGANGRCFAFNGGSVGYCMCTYDACGNDSDCPAGNTCACHGSAYTGGAGNTCKASDCRVDADCGPGGFCSASVDLTTCNGAGVGGYYCHTPSDVCINDSDCPGTDGVPACAYSTATGRWQCASLLGCL